MSSRTERLEGGTLLTALGAGAGLSALSRATAVVFVTLLTIVGAQVSIPLPFTPVPLTLQPMIVLLGAAALGSRLGAYAQVLYLALGIAGMPVFAASPALPQGIARLLGPTGGYLMSYPLAAFVAGFLAEHGFDRRYITSVAAMSCGLAIIFYFGVLWLAFGVPHAGLSAAVASGLAPFLLADIVKVFLAATVLPAAWKLLR
jgi:biotin transport system substrate-specific component